MPRDASGFYTLPSSNPVFPGTVIESAWANETMDDIADQLNNVLTADGEVGPSGPFELLDGTELAPGLAFQAQPSTGIWRDPVNRSIKFSWGGVAAFGISDEAILVTGVGKRFFADFTTPDIEGKFTFATNQANRNTVVTCAPNGTGDPGESGSGWLSLNNLDDAPNIYGLVVGAGGTYARCALAAVRASGSIPSRPVMITNESQVCQRSFINGITSFDNAILGTGNDLPGWSTSPAQLIGIELGVGLSIVRSGFGHAITNNARYDGASWVNVVDGGASRVLHSQTKWDLQYSVAGAGATSAFATRFSYDMSTSTAAIIGTVRSTTFVATPTP